MMDVGRARPTVRCPDGWPLNIESATDQIHNGCKSCVVVSGFIPSDIRLRLHPQKISWLQAKVLAFTRESGTLCW